MRLPKNPRVQILDAFRGAPNLRYLQEALTRAPLPPATKAAELAYLSDNVLAFAAGSGPAQALADPLALRGGSRRGAPGLWPEVQRLNRAFLAGRAAAVADLAVYLDPAVAERARLLPAADGAEDFAFQMFTADSLRPPGLEHLNAAPFFSIYSPDESAAGALQWDDNRAPRWSGPPQAGHAGAADRPQPGASRSALFRAAEQGTSLDDVGADSCFVWRDCPAAAVPAALPAASPFRSEPFMALNPANSPAMLELRGAVLEQTAKALPRRRQVSAAACSLDPSVPDCDRAWSAPDPDRSPETALAEYMAECGFGPATPRRSFVAEADTQIGPEGRKVMRYQGIPLWQQYGYRNYDRDIDETLGQAYTQYEGQVRRWDMSALRGDDQGSRYY